MNMPTKPRIALIAAMAQNRVIGRDNTLPWRLPDDLKRFKALTLGHAIIMGRKTWDSLGRPLPGRDNIVISRQTDLHIEGAQVFNSLEAAIEHCRNRETVFVIGGAQLYAQALPIADELHLTEVGAHVEGDAFFPPIDEKLFRETNREPHPADEKNQHPFAFVTLQRY